MEEVCSIKRGKGDRKRSRREFEQSPPQRKLKEEEEEVSVEPLYSPFGVSSSSSPLVAADGLQVRKCKVRAAGDSKRRKRAKSVEEPLECGICFDKFEDRGVLDSCKHVFCYSCIDQWLERSCRCPHCKAAVCSLTSSKTGVVRRVVQRELKETLEEEEDEIAEDDDDDEDEEDHLHEVLDNVSLMARSLGYQFLYEHRAETTFSEPLRVFVQQPVAPSAFPASTLSYSPLAMQYQPTLHSWSSYAQQGFLCQQQCPCQCPQPHSVHSVHSVHSLEPMYVQSSSFVVPWVIALPPPPHFHYFSSS